MNAVGVKDDAHLQVLLRDKNYIAQEKLDGMRAIVHVTANGLRIFSRSAGVEDPTRPLEKTSALPHLAVLKFPGLIGTIIDCEILARGMDSAELSGSIHKKNGSNGQVRLFVFDVLHYCSNDLTMKSLSQRLQWLQAIKEQMENKVIRFLPYAKTAQEKQWLYTSVLEKGGEGIMLKRLDAMYVLGGRPSGNWFKAKKSATFDCVVMGFSIGKGKYNSQIGAIRFGQYINSPNGWILKELGQASGMTDDERKEFTRNPNSHIGKVITIKGMERLKSGAIRHPVFIGIRHDKNPDQCRWYESEQ